MSYADISSPEDLDGPDLEELAFENAIVPYSEIEQDTGVRDVAPSIVVI